MPVTIREVAKATGYSVGTISSVINNKGHIGSETRAKVMAAVRRMGYDPASNLVRQPVTAIRNLGLVLPTTNGSANPFYYRAVSTLNQMTGGRGYGCTIFTESDIVARTEKHLNLGREQLGCSGLIVFCPLADWRTYVPRITAAGTPVVLVRRDNDIPGSMVVTDNDYKGMIRLLEHLYGQGHRSLLYYCQDEGSGESPDRQRAWRDFIAAHGLPAQPERIVVQRHLQAGTHDGRNRNNSSQEFPHLVKLARSVTGLLRSGLAPTAVVCDADHLAVELSKALLADGYRIPEDVAVAGYSNNATAMMFHPGITTVNVPVEEMIEAACNLIFDYDPGRKQVKTVLEFENKLIVREST